ncbi:hypothetical protein C8R46DRAFT_1346420 [Mycena filopes]|nr:hypothetical protein C8R46DRAFT_1346420 [Mycena filopes]
MLSLDQDRAHIIAFNAQILDLRRSLSKLRKARDVVQARLDAFNKYPVLTLPNEVVCEIFTRFVPTYPLRPPLFGPESPTLLTQICRLWREIAVRTPALWRAIDFSNYVPSLSYQAYICGIWLERSLSAPLSMRIGNGDAMRIGDADALLDTSGVLPIAIPHRERWEYLKIDLRLSEAAIVIPGPMPLLRHLDLANDDSLDDTNMYPDLVALLDAPLLCSVILDNVTTRYIVLPWAQITSLTLKNAYATECAPVLAQMCNLVHCRLNLYNSRSHPYHHLPHVSLPHLETLVMTDARGPAGPVEEYLDTFVVPALLTLQVPGSFLGPEPIDYISSFISTSGCKLRELVITGYIESTQSYEEAFPSICDFHLRWYPNLDEEYYANIQSDAESSD